MTQASKLPGSSRRSGGQVEPHQGRHRAQSITRSLVVSSRKHLGNGGRSPQPHGRGLVFVQSTFGCIAAMIWQFKPTRSILEEIAH